MLDMTRPFRCYRLNFYPYAMHTVVMLVCTDYKGRTETQHREHTWDLAIPAVEWHVASRKEAVLYALRELIDTIDPPPPHPWAKPPESPDGDYRGEPLPGNYIQPPLDDCATIKAPATPPERSAAKPLDLGRKSDGKSDGPEVDE